MLKNKQRIVFDRYSLSNQVALCIQYLTRIKNPVKTLMLISKDYDKSNS